MPLSLERGVRFHRLKVLDRPRVAELAEKMGFDASAQWIRENPGLYAARCVLRV